MSASADSWWDGFTIHLRSDTSTVRGLRRKVNWEIKAYVASRHALLDAMSAIRSTATDKTMDALGNAYVNAMHDDITYLDKELRQVCRVYKLLFSDIEKISQEADRFSNEQTNEKKTVSDISKSFALILCTHVNKIIRAVDGLDSATAETAKRAFNDIGSQQQSEQFDAQKALNNFKDFNAAFKILLRAEKQKEKKNAQNDLKKCVEVVNKTLEAELQAVESYVWDAVTLWKEVHSEIQRLTDHSGPETIRDVADKNLPSVLQLVTPVGQHGFGFPEKQGAELIQKITALETYHKETKEDLVGKLRIILSKFKRLTP